MTFLPWPYAGFFKAVSAVEYMITELSYVK